MVLAFSDTINVSYHTYIYMLKLGNLAEGIYNGIFYKFLTL